jgi:hypothetical protein
MYLYHLYGFFSDRLIGFSSFATIADWCSPAVLSHACEPIRAGSHSAPPVTRNYRLDHILKPEAVPLMPVSTSIENLDRGTGNSSRIGFAR